MSRGQNTHSSDIAHDTALATRLPHFAGWGCGIFLSAHYQRYPPEWKKARPANGIQ